MFFKKPEKEKEDTDYNIISSETNIEGKIYSPHSIKIEGMVTGEIISTGEVVIGEQGRARANIKAKDIVIEGSLTGNIILSGEAKITSTGKLSGNVIQMDALLTIEPGGFFKGKNIITDNKELFKINKGSTFSNIKIKPKKILEY